jgi:hypothetical protein
MLDNEQVLMKYVPADILRIKGTGNSFRSANDISVENEGIVLKAAQRQ